MTSQDGVNIMRPSHNRNEDEWTFVGSAFSELPARPSSAKRARNEDNVAAFRHSTPEPQESKAQTPPPAPKKPRQIFDSIEIPVSSKPFLSKITQASSLSRASLERILRNVRPSPKLRIDKDFEGCHAKRHPRLLYRAFEPAHGFKARRFLKPTTKIPNPPDIGISEFREAVEPHLRIDKMYKSPFLSLTASARYALKIIGMVKPPRSLAIFDFNDVEEDLVDRFGQLCRPYLVCKICEEHELYDLPRGYTGQGEWLVWAGIKCKPIVVFNRDEALELRRTLKSMDELNEESGTRLGKLLIDVDNERKELVARSLVKALKVPGCSVNYHCAQWDDFADAVYAVSRGDRALSVISSLRGMSLEEPANGDDMIETIELLKAHGKRILREAQGQLQGEDENADSDIQDLVDAQLAAEGHDYGLTVDGRSSTPTPPHPAVLDNLLDGLEDYLDDDITFAASCCHSQNADSIPEAELTPPSSASSTRTQPIDLTISDASDSDFEVEFEIIGSREASGTPIPEDTDEDMIILGTGRRGRRALTLRSKS